MDGGPITVTETVGLGDRLKSSCCFICVGIILFIGSVPFMFWNENIAVDRYNANQEGKALAQSVSPLQLDSTNDGKLVHFTATVSKGSDVVLADSVFGVKCTTSDCLALKRHTEMYQWKERSESTTKTNTGGSKTTTTSYYYDQIWSNQLINSNNFHDTSSTYKNPSQRFSDQDFVVSPIMAGAYELPSNIVSWFIRDQTSFDVSTSDITDATLKSEAKATTKTPSNGLYFGKGTERSPQIGDERVWFSEALPAEITVVGVQTDKTIGAFISEEGDGAKVLLYERGNYTIAEIFEKAENDRVIRTWVLRFVGFGMMAFGLMSIFNPLQVMSDVIPCIGSIVGCGITFISITIAAVLSIITISVAWLVVRPVFGAIVLGVGLVVICACAFGVKMLLNRRDSDDDVKLEVEEISVSDPLEEGGKEEPNADDLEAGGYPGDDAGSDAGDDTGNDSPPKKYIKDSEGKMTLNPEYTEWKNSQ